MTEPTWVGDLIQSLDALQPTTDDAAIEIATMLGVPAIPAPAAATLAAAGASPVPPLPVTPPQDPTQPDQPVPASSTSRSAVRSPTSAGSRVRVRRSLDVPTGVAGAAIVGAWFAGWISAASLLLLVVTAVLLNVVARGVMRRRQVLPARSSTAVELSAGASDPTTPGPARETPGPTTSRDGQSGLSSALDLDASALAAPTSTSSTVPWTPLLDQRRMRSLASAVLQVEKPVGIDIGAAVRTLAGTGSLGVLPQRTAGRVAARAVVMIDESEALDGVRRDQDAIVEAMRTVCGPGLQVVRFTADPLHTYAADDEFGLGPRVPLAEVLPARAPALVVLSDFGIGRRRRAIPGSPQAWSRFDTFVCQRGMRRRYLVPYPEDRWPSHIRAMPISCWSDELSVRGLRTLR